eukprot:scaffold119706_cov48-Phaeocystis_antarctica.AAC.2
MPLLLSSCSPGEAERARPRPRVDAHITIKQGRRRWPMHSVRGRGVCGEAKVTLGHMQGQG